MEALPKNSGSMKYQFLPCIFTFLAHSVFICSCVGPIHFYETTCYHWPRRIHSQNLPQGGERNNKHGTREGGVFHGSGFVEERWGRGPYGRQERKGKQISCQMMMVLSFKQRHCQFQGGEKERNEATLDRTISGMNLQICLGLFQPGKDPDLYFIWSSVLRTLNAWTTHGVSKGFRVENTTIHPGIYFNCD